MSHPLGVAVPSRWLAFVACRTPTSGMRQCPRKAGRMTKESELVRAKRRGVFAAMDLSAPGGEGLGLEPSAHSSTLQLPSN